MPSDAFLNRKLCKKCVFGTADKLTTKRRWPENSREKIHVNNLVINSRFRSKFTLLFCISKFSTFGQCCYDGRYQSWRHFSK